MLFETERRSWSVSGPKETVPRARPRAWSGLAFEYQLAVPHDQHATDVPDALGGDQCVEPVRQFPAKTLPPGGIASAGTPAGRTTWSWHLALAERGSEHATPDTSITIVLQPGYEPDWRVRRFCYGRPSAWGCHRGASARRRTIQAARWFTEAAIQIAKIQSPATISGAGLKYPPSGHHYIRGSPRRAPPISLIAGTNKIWGIALGLQGGHALKASLPSLFNLRTDRRSA